MHTMEVMTSVEVAPPPEDVFAYISDAENNPQWQSGMVSAHWSTDGPIGVGSTYDQVATFLGRRIESTFEVEAYVPGRMIKASSTGGSFPITFTRMVEPNGAGSKVTAIIEGDASGFFKVAEPILAWLVQRSVDGDYRALTARLAHGGDD
jgi:carbon monoxide dehydrogenase subunit G